MLRVRRAAWIALGFVLAIVALAVLAIVSLRDRATPADVSYDGPVGTEPGDPGVYRFDTAGFESVDALAGARHDYPAVTAVIIEQGSCGPVVRWEPLSQRSDEWWMCGPDSVDRIVEHHEWFGIGDTTDTECAGLVLHPTAADRWDATCSRPETAVAIVLEHLGDETLSIDGRAVLTTHIRMTETTTGRTTGSRVTDLWMVPGTPLFARKRVVDRSTSTSPIGEVTYVEEYTLELRSLTPGR